MQPQQDLWIGRLIGDQQRYRLEARLGEGGMGYVFLARDTRLNKQVALKLLKDTLVGSEELRKRFEREVQLCVALESDHIVDVSDYGVTAEGHPFYVMEYLRGQTLGQLLQQQKRLPVERTANIIIQVCEGLLLAHEGATLRKDGAMVSEQIKVVHRDLKPDNIFLIGAEPKGLVKILDFGIAKIREDRAEYTGMTTMFVGTYHYAAPEQLRIAKNLDGRADIYSLGILLYEMLSGTDPFGLGLNIGEISNGSWSLAHTSEPPRLLRSQPGCEQLSPELEAVVMRCLQKAPNQRFASVNDLKQALQLIGSDSPGSQVRNSDITVPQNLGKNSDITISQNPVKNSVTTAPTLNNSTQRFPPLIIGTGIATLLAITVAVIYRNFPSRPPQLQKFTDVHDVPKGKFEYGGSTSWAPIRAQVDNAIKTVRPEFKLVYINPVNTSPNSGTGIAMLLKGELAFAQSSRSIRDSEYSQAQQRGFQLQAIPVAIDGLAVGVHPSLNIPGLTLAQLASIYSGEIINWNKIGGPDLQITPYSRPVSSHGGTVDLFVSAILKGRDFGASVKFIPETTLALRELKNAPGGIYYASASEIIPQCTIKPISLSSKPGEFVSPYQKPFVPFSQCPGQRNRPNLEAFQKDQYPITRKLFVVVKQNGHLEE